MGLPVRTVCVACLHSLEVTSGEEFGSEPSCPHCGHQIEPGRVRSEAPTGEGFALEPMHPDIPTPRFDVKGTGSSGVIGRFILREPVGEGGYGEVFRAYDSHLERDVALKILKPSRLNDKALERFFREARAAARLDHPNIVALHDAGRHEDRCWIAYQLVEGRTLSLFRELEQPALDASVRIVRDLALALDHAHGRGVFHRDLKPANILIDASGRARLTDFGLARRFDLDSDLTVEGTVLGTPQYMSPEAAAGRAHEADGRSDVYSLGVILYEMICGKRPSDLPSNVPIWKSTRFTTPPTPRSVDRGIPSELDRICMKALAFDPEARYPAARALADALTRYLKGRRSASLPLAARSKRGLTLWLAVVVSALWLVLGISSRIGVTQKEDTSILLALGTIPGPKNSTARIEPAVKSADDGKPAKPADVEHSSTSAQVKATVHQPVYEGTLDDLWSLPVVWVQGSSELKIHRKGCQHLARTAEARIKDVGNARTAVATGYKPCKSCLKLLSQSLEVHPAP